MTKKLLIILSIITIIIIAGSAAAVYFLPGDLFLLLAIWPGFGLSVLSLIIIFFVIKKRLYKNRWWKKGIFIGTILYLSYIILPYVVRGRWDFWGYWIRGRDRLLIEEGIFRFLIALLFILLFGLAFLSFSLFRRKKRLRYLFGGVLILLFSLFWFFFLIVFPGIG